MDRDFYFQTLYPFQDEILRALQGANTGFYLTDGTAVSRGYLQHHFSDDLDLFTNDAPEFTLWSDRCIETLSTLPRLQLDIALRESRLVRLTAARSALVLKIELVNDVPSRVGDIKVHPVLGRLDSAENILANKLSALVDRQEPRDAADVWGFSCRLGLPITRALEHAHGKAAGLFPVDVARVLLGTDRKDWELVRWIEAPEPELYLSELHALGEELLQLDPPRP